MLTILIVFANHVLITLTSHDRFVTYCDQHSSNQSRINADSSALHGVNSISLLRLQNSISALMFMCAIPIIHHAHLLSPLVIS